MAFTLQHVGVIVYAIAFTLAAGGLSFYGRSTGFTTFDATVIALFIATFASFQLYFYSVVEAGVPSSVSKSLLQYFLQVIPNFKTKLATSNKLNQAEYDVKAKQMKQSNKDSILNSPMFGFIMANIVLAVVFMLAYTRPFTYRYKFLTWSDLKILGVWLSVAVTQIILYLIIVWRHNYVRKSEIFGYGINVLRKAAITSAISQTKASPSVISDKDLKRVSASLQSITDKSQSIDLDLDGMPSIPRRLRDKNNVHVIILASLTIVALGYVLFNLVVTDNRGAAITTSLFIAVMCYYMYLYTNVTSIEVQTSMQDPDMLIYELSR